MDIDEVAYSIENVLNIGSTTAGAGAGKVTFNDLLITKKIDNSSPVFFLNLASGKSYKSMSIIYVRTGAAPTAQAFMSLQFGLVGTAKIESSVASGDIQSPKEHITFQYGGIKLQVLPFDAAGKPLKVATTSWNRIKNISSLDAQTAVPALDLINISNQLIR